jgi:FkbM family methyltransferase
MNPYTFLQQMGRKPFNSVLARTVMARCLARVRPNVVVDVGPDKIALDLRDPIIARSVFVHREYDAHVLSIVESLELRGKTCVDVGANIGLYAMALSRFVGQQGTVFALEPEQKNFDLLMRNRALNNASNVNCVQAAVGATRGTITLAVNPYNWGDHWIANGASDPEWAGKQSCERVTLDDQLASVLPGAVSFIKIDVQGHELSVLQGMKDVLARNPNAVLLVEVSPSHLRNAGTSPRELVQRLIEAGLGGWDVLPGRVLPLAAPEAYELMQGRNWADLLLCRTPETLARKIRALYAA